MIIQAKLQQHAGGGGGETQYVGWEATKVDMIYGKGILLQKGAMGRYVQYEGKRGDGTKQGICVVEASGF